MGQSVHNDSTDSLCMKGAASMLSYRQALEVVDNFMDAHTITVAKRKVREDNKRTYIKGFVNVDNSLEKVYIIIKDKDDVIEAEWTYIDGYKATYLCNEFQKMFAHYGFVEK